jgi:hypothetical protein
VKECTSKTEIEAILVNKVSAAELQDVKAQIQQQMEAMLLRINMASFADVKVCSFLLGSLPLIVCRQFCQIPDSSYEPKAGELEQQFHLLVDKVHLIQVKVCNYVSEINIGRVLAAPRDCSTWRT